MLRLCGGNAETSMNVGEAMDQARAKNRARSQARRDARARANGNGTLTLASDLFIHRRSGECYALSVLISGRIGVSCWNDE